MNWKYYLAVKINRVSSISYAWNLVSYTKVVVYFKVKQQLISHYIAMVSFLVFLFLGTRFWLVGQDLLDFFCCWILVSRLDRYGLLVLNV